MVIIQPYTYFNYYIVTDFLSVTKKKKKMLKDKINMGKKAIKQIAFLFKNDC